MLVDKYLRRNVYNMNENYHKFEKNLQLKPKKFGILDNNSAKITQSQKKNQIKSHFLEKNKKEKNINLDKENQKKEKIVQNSKKEMNNQIINSKKEKNNQKITHKIYELKKSKEAKVENKTIQKNNSKKNYKDMNKPQKLSLKNLSWYTFSLYHDSPFRIVVGIGENPSTKETKCLIPKKEILKIQKYAKKDFDYYEIKAFEEFILDQPENLIFSKHQ